MLTISQKDLDKLVKDKGWQLTPDSKKAAQEQKTASTLSKQVEAITSLVESVDGIKDALRANAEKDYAAIINKLAESIRSITIPQAATIAESEPTEGWNFIVKRDSEGFISEIMAERK